MDLESSYHDYEQAVIQARHRKASDKLLARMAEHHDYAVPRRHVKIKEVEEVSAPVPVRKTPEKVWAERQKAIPLPKPDWASVIGEITIKPRYNVFDIIDTVAAYFKITRSGILSADRHKETVYPRQLAMYFCKKLTVRSLPEIGRRFGGKDHTTVLHALRKMERLSRSDWMVAYDIAHIEPLL